MIQTSRSAQLWRLQKHKGCYLDAFDSLVDLGQIVVHLELQPASLGRAAEGLGQADSHTCTARRRTCLRRDAGMAVEQQGQRLAADAQTCRGLGGCQLQRLSRNGFAGRIELSRKDKDDSCATRRSAMPTVAIEPTLYQRVEQAALESQVSTGELFTQALRRYLWELDRRKIAEESKAYRRQHAELKERHLGQYIRDGLSTMTRTSRPCANAYANSSVARQ